MPASRLSRRFVILRRTPSGEWKTVQTVYQASLAQSALNRAAARYGHYNVRIVQR